MTPTYAITNILLSDVTPVFFFGRIGNLLGITPEIYGIDYYMESIPAREQLSRRERLVKFGQEVLDQLAHIGLFWAGLPAPREQLRLDLRQIEDYANNPWGDTQR